ncbi:MAG: tetratricopeptide repeat protein, partial [Planctomycetaceae bacterium]
MNSHARTRTLTLSTAIAVFTLLSAGAGETVSAGTAEHALAEHALAQVPPPPSPPRDAPSAERLEGLQLQPLDEPLEPLVPVRPRTAAEQTRLKALAHFMTGQMLERRNRFREAYEEYKQAVELDPDAVEVYQALVPLAFSLNDEETARKYADRAVELDPDNYQLLRRLGIQMAGERKLPEAVQLLEKALKSPRLKHDSADYVTLSRDLGILYGALGEKEKAADAYLVVFEARTEGEKFHLDFQTREALQRDPTTSFERIGRAFLDANRPKLAAKAFERSVDAGESRPAILSYNLARVYLQTKEYDKALEELQTYFDAQLQSQGRDAYQLLAEILDAQDKSGELISRLEALSKADARNSTLHYFLAEQYLLADRLDDAETLFRKTLEQSGDPAGYMGLAAVYRRQGRPAELLDALAEGLKGGPDAVQLETELKAIQEDKKLLDGMFRAGRKTAAEDESKLGFIKSYILAKLAVESKRTDEAIEFYRLALKLKLQPQQAATLYDELADHLFEVERYSDAAQTLRDAAADPAAQGRKPDFLLRLSYAEEFLGNTQAAFEAVREAQRIVPN